MNKNKKIILLVLIAIGIIVPFVPTLMAIEMFFLLIPFAIIFGMSLIWLIVSFLNKNLNSQKALFIFSILPIFLFSQILSGFTVDKIQKFRSIRIISEIERLKFENGILPNKFELIAGIHYTKTKNKEHFRIEYSRGFMITKKYDSENKNWKSYGWND